LALPVLAAVIVAIVLIIRAVEYPMLVFGGIAALALLVQCCNSLGGDDSVTYIVVSYIAAVLFVFGLLGLGSAYIASESASKWRELELNRSAPR
jgi:hypothetical protein